MRAIYRPAHLSCRSDIRCGDVCSGNWTLFAGGMQRNTHGDRFTLSALHEPLGSAHSHSHVVLDLTSRLVDYVTLDAPDSGTLRCVASLTTNAQVHSSTVNMNMNMSIRVLCRRAAGAAGSARRGAARHRVGLSGGDGRASATAAAGLLAGRAALPVDDALVGHHLLEPRARPAARHLERAPRRRPRRAPLRV